jgi:hypothetical protein
MPQEMMSNEYAGTKVEGPRMRPVDTTLRKNIDQRIEDAQKEVEKLTAIKARLEASGLLDTRIDDLTQAMRW